MTTPELNPSTSTGSVSFYFDEASSNINGDNSIYNGIDASLSTTQKSSLHTPSPQKVGILVSYSNIRSLKIFFMLFSRY